MRQVDGNKPTFDYIGLMEGYAMYSNIPIRLEIASRILAGVVSRETFHGSIQWEEAIKREYPEKALAFADALIKAHNESVDG